MSFSRILKFVSLAAIGSLVLSLPEPVRAADEPTDGLTVTKRDCRRVVAHQPSGDVAYKPGVDVRGNPVAGANVPGSVIIETPKTITIPLTLELADLFSLPEGVSAEAGIGKVEYDIGSGRLEFNGQPLTDPQMAAIAAACANMKK